MRLTRREFLIGGLGLAASGWIGTRLWRGLIRREIPGRICGASWKAAHRLREGGFPSPSRTIKTSVAIVGGGIAGLSAAWKLKKGGSNDFLLLDLEADVGGNSLSGENAISPYPWGAHYVPIPGPEARDVRELFEELGVIEGYDGQGRPRYNDYHLCAAPEERLYIHGLWQEGLLPQTGISQDDRRQYKDFFGAMETFKHTYGRDGRRAFAIPLEESSRDERFLRFDKTRMTDYMAERGWNSEPLNWYVDYACRDDYGCRSRDVSAWAGIHYFASRSAESANAKESDILTWPDGNGWIVKKLKEKIRTGIRPDALVFRVAQTSAQKSGGAEVDFLDLPSGEAVRILCDAVIYAAPRFTAHRILKGFPEAETSSRTFTYAPWMVANLSLDGLPEGEGAPLSWDNVFYQSPSLGYVVATHQSLTSRPKKTVLTYYHPLSDEDPQAARRSAFDRRYEDWRKIILKDLVRVHPGIEEKVERIDVWIWGHGMIRPTPGFIWGEDRARAQRPWGNVFFAHSDMSGISIFEEAHYWGCRAAEDVLKRLGA